MWRASHEALPISANLLHINVMKYALCPMCGLENETVGSYGLAHIHVMFSFFAL